MSINRKSIVYYLINLVYITSFLIWILFNWDSSKVISNYGIFLLPWIIFLMFVQLLSFYLKKRNIYDFGLWYIILSYLFMFGLLFFDVFSLETNLIWNPILYYSKDVLFYSNVFIILSMEAFMLGYLHFNSEEIPAIKNEKSSKKIYYIGVILFVIGFVCRLINDLRIIEVTGIANSYSAYSTAGSAGLIDDFAFFLVPGISFLCFSGCLNRKKINILCIGSIIYLATTMMLTGSRKIQIFSILTIFLIWLYSDKKHLSFKRIIILIVATLLLLNLVIVIRDTRFNLNQMFPTYIETLQSGKVLSNILGEVLSETGLTGLSVANIFSIVPIIKPYEWGITFLRTIPSFLPIGWLLGDFFNLASSTEVINTYINIPVGSSIIGDFYWNFGFIGGVIFAFLFGFFISKVLHITFKSQRKSIAMYFSIFSFLIILVRAELIDVFRPIVYLFVGVFLLESLFLHKFRKG